MCREVYTHTRVCVCVFNIVTGKHRACEGLQIRTLMDLKCTVYVTACRCLSLSLTCVMHLYRQAGPWWGVTVPVVNIWHTFCVCAAVHCINTWASGRNMIITLPPSAVSTCLSAQWGHEWSFLCLKKKKKGKKRMMPCTNYTLLITKWHKILHSCLQISVFFFDCCIWN